MSLSGNKTLLIFFGEFRTFPVIPKQLIDLDKVDIIFSTWKKIQTHGKDFTLKQSDIDLCYKLLPNIKLLLSEDIDFGPEKRYHSHKMYYHWMNSINSIENENQYDRVFFHRCDMISNWNIILNQEWDSDTLYIQTENSPLVEIDKFWINDYYFGGDFKIVKKFVNSFKENNDAASHFPIGNKIIENNFNWKNLKIKTHLIRKWHYEFISELNNNDIKFINEKRDSDFVKRFVEIHNIAVPKFPINLETFS